MQRIKVLIVDDSAVVRQVLTQILGSDAGIEVIGAAPDPLFAMERMSRQWPDVIVVDVEMPRMDGITFLRKIMNERPTPVVVCSSLTEKGAQTTMQALAAGAVATIAKPRSALKQQLQDTANELIYAVKAAAQANVRRLKVTQETLARPHERLTADAVLRAAAAPAPAFGERVVAIGTSTGGTQALEYVLRALPKTCPGLVIVQHMPEKFTLAFAQRLNSICDIEVAEAKTNDRVQAGRALIAPGGRHMLLHRSGSHYYVEVVDGPLVNRHRPSVDVLFRSTAQAAGRSALGIIMTGMGDDGARGLKEMHDAGAATIAQDEESCVVFGMPKESIKLGAADRVLPLGEIAQAIMGMPQRG